MRRRWGAVRSGVIACGAAFVASSVGVPLLAESATASERAGVNAAQGAVSSLGVAGGGAARTGIGRATVTPATAPIWGPTIDLSPTGEAVEPSLAMSSSGRVIASLWRQGSGSQMRIQYAVTPDAGATWGAVVDLTAAGLAAAEPDLAMSSDGSVQAATWWRSNGANKIIQVRASGDSGATWSSPVDLSATGSDATDPQVAVSSDGSRQTVVWRRGAFGFQRVQVSTSSDGGATWSSASDLSVVGNALPPAIAISADGLHQAITWSYSSGSNYTVQMSTSSDGGATWSSPVDLSAAGASARGATVAMSADGLQQAASWVRGNNVVQSRSSSDGGATWGSATNLSVDFGYHYNPSLAMSADGSHRTISWYFDSSPGYAQSRSSADGGATWGSLVRLSGPADATGSDLPAIAMSDDGEDQTVAWSMETSDPEVVQSASTSDGGLSWEAAVAMSTPGNGAYEPRAAMSADGLIQAVAWYRWNGSYNRIQVATAIATPPPPPPPPPPVYPPSSPVGIAGVAGDESVSLSWTAPVTSGSFPVSTYQAVVSPGGQSCLVVAPTTSCTIAALSNGTPYAASVRALNGAGWGAFSAPSGTFIPEQPAAPTITITGTRTDVKGASFVRVAGTTTGFGVGAVLQPWIRFPGQDSYTQGFVSIILDSRGEFTWQRRTSKTLYVFMRSADGAVESNRLILRAL